MGKGLDVAESIFTRFATIGSNRNELGLRECLVLIKVVKNPDQSYKFYAENSGISNTARMNRTVSKLSEAALIEADWNPEKPNQKALKPTSQGVEVAKALDEWFSEFCPNC